MAKEESIYRNILARAWRLAWRNKVLWILGGLSLFLGNLGAYNVLDRSFGFPDLVSYSDKPGLASSVVHQATGASIAVGVAIMLLILGVIAGFVVLVTIARGGLIDAVARRDGSKSVAVGESLARGKSALWPLLGIALLSRIDVPLSLFVLVPFARRAALSGQEHFAIFLVVFIIITLLSLTLSFLGIYASAYVMLKGEGFVSALRKGVALFARFWLISIEMALILYAVTLLVGIGLIVAGFVIGIPLMLLYFIFLFMHVPGAIFIVGIPAAILYIALLLCAGSAFATFHIASWTILFKRLSEEGAVAKVVRLTARFGHIFHRKLI